MPLDKSIASCSAGWLGSGAWAAWAAWRALRRPRARGSASAWYEPVSYTHLDVYKRQDDDLEAVPAEGVGGGGADAGAASGDDRHGRHKVLPFSRAPCRPCLLYTSRCV